MNLIDRSFAVFQRLYQFFILKQISGTFTFRFVYNLYCFRASFLFVGENKGRALTRVRNIDFSRKLLLFEFGVLPKVV